jgi:hypothetical protein
MYTALKNCRNTKRIFALLCVDIFSHHETNNIFEIRCVATIFWRIVIKHDITIAYWIKPFY